MDPVVISPTGRNPKLRRNGPSNVFERTISEIDKARTARSRRNIDFQLLLYTIQGVLLVVVYQG